MVGAFVSYGGARSLERVLHVLAGLLDVRAGLICLALCFETLVVGNLAGRFLDLALGFFRSVADLVVETHQNHSSRVGNTSTLRRRTGLRIRNDGVPQGPEHLL